jgi:hypothetical protein
MGVIGSGYINHFFEVVKFIITLYIGNCVM